MVSSKKFFLAWLIAAAAFTPIANAETLGFDDIPGPVESIVPNGYGSLNWTNLYVLDTVAYGAQTYKNATVSGSHVAFSYAGEHPGSYSTLSNPLPFTFNSVWMTAAWQDLNIRVVATGTNSYSTNFVLRAGELTAVTLDWVGVTSVRFSSTFVVAPDYEAGAQFAFDDMVLSDVAPLPSVPTLPVPEPENYAMMLAGLGVMGFIARRRKQS